jgi:hypothetical protein
LDKTPQAARPRADAYNSARSESPQAKSGVLVVGLPRAGATWVGETLSCAENAALVNEPDNETFNAFAVRAKLRLGRYPVLDADDQAPDDYATLWRQAFAGMSTHRGLRRMVAESLMRSFDRAELWNAFCNVREPRATLRLRAVAALASPPTSLPKAPGHVVVKSAHGPLAVEWIARQFQPRVVIVLRHPLNVVASWMELGWGGCSLDTHPKVIERYMRRWHLPALPATCSRLSRVSWEVGLFSSALRSAAERHSDWWLVDHEQLCRDPSGGFRQLFVALGLQWTDAAELHLANSNRPGTGLVTRRIAADQPERWRKRLTGEQVREISGVLESFPVLSGLL